MKTEELKNKGRRRFLKSLALAPVAGAALAGAPARASSGDEYAKLVDSSKCIGCLRCVSSCNRWNELPAENTFELTGRTFMVVNKKAPLRNRNMGRFVKWQCQHCREPACVRVCPTKAIRKFPEGAVVIMENECIACQSCHLACPFDVPRLDFQMGVTRKCHLCYNRYTGTAYHGKVARTWSKPSCVGNCPVSALDFGPRDRMIRKAEARIREVGGYLHGITEAGGTNVLTILPADTKAMGMADPPDKFYYHTAHRFMSDLAKPLIVIALGLSGVTVAGMLAKEIATAVRGEESEDGEGKED